MAAAVPLVDEFVEDLWYDEPAAGAPSGAAEDAAAPAAPTTQRSAGPARPATPASPAAFL